MKLGKNKLCEINVKLSKIVIVRKCHLTTPEMSSQFFSKITGSSSGPLFHHADSPKKSLSRWLAK